MKGIEYIKYSKFLKIYVVFVEDWRMKVGWEY